MDPQGSVTRCIHDIGGGPRRNDAARELWDRFFAGLARYAAGQLRALGADRGVADEEDAAARAFAKVCRGLESGQLRLADRTALRKLLFWATRREVIDQANRHHDPGLDKSDIARIPDAGPTPELRAVAEEECRQLLDGLGDDTLRRIALWKLVGLTNEEIRGRLNCSLAKVERKLGRIREKWAGVAPDAPPHPGPRGTSLPHVVECLESTTVILHLLV